MVRKEGSIAPFFLFLAFALAFYTLIKITSFYYQDRKKEIFSFSLRGVCPHCCHCEEACRADEAVSKPFASFSQAKQFETVNIG
ncbi:hypothetical protein TH606_06710 [Thermodesulfatator autotrophicus]|uniref:Uncharacterized protein n=1 Tax=Thermodesulfatator autotrophicus TaxID=1795632 RepID=A0A177E6B9_9BACT|nr:hypothetical protein TH606_06710 [Thermodesulfatator autotrophicus]